MSLWFALHVIFGRVEGVRHGPLFLWTPDLGSFDLEAALLAILAAILLLGLKRGIITTLAATAGAAVALRVLPLA